jgi:hypothetical protein
MATHIPPLSWTCPQCGQQVPAGQTACPNCAGAGAPPPPAPPTQPQAAPQPAPAPQSPPQQPVPQPPADEDEGWLTRHRLLFIGGVVVILILLVTLMTRGCGSGAQRTTPPPAAPPAASAPAVVTASKPSPAPAPPAAPAKPAKAAQPHRAAISLSDLRQEIKKAVEEALRANQAEKGQPVEVKINPPEITVRVVREEPSSAPPQPRREKLSDRELERRFKERLLQQEP